MKSRLNSERTAIRRHVLSKGVVMDSDTELQTDFDTLFKQFFCVAAQELADGLKQPLQDLGFLYDDILSTTVATSKVSKMMGLTPIHRHKGQLIFTVRHLSKQEAARLSASGFRFAYIEHVTPILSRRIHVPETELSNHLIEMRDYATSSRNFQPGIHLISFVMRPTIHDHFEILTAKGTGNPLPSATLPIKRLQMQHLELMSHMEGLPILACLNWLDSEQARTYHDISDFRKQLIEGMSSLLSTLSSDVNAATAFCPRPLLAPCRGSNLTAEGQRCFVLAFCAVGTLGTRVTTPNLTFTPLRLFRAQQQVNDGVFHRDVFSKELSQELFYSSIESETGETGETGAKPFRSTFRRWPTRKLSTAGLSTISQESLVESSPSPLAEIMVRKEVRVDVSKYTSSSASASSSAGTLSPMTTVVGAEDMTASTYVDELYSFCYSPDVRMRSDAVSVPPTSPTLVAPSSEC